jgi:hypothetical protein
VLAKMLHLLGGHGGWDQRRRAATPPELLANAKVQRTAKRVR